jgi:hypothetical protein
MSTIARRFEVSANVAIIILALLLGIGLTKGQLWPRTDDPAERQQQMVHSGAKLSLPNVDWAQNGRTLLIVISTDCNYCSDSAAFYREIINKRQDGNLKVIAVLPQDAKIGRQYLNDLALAVDDVKQISLKSIQISATPSLVLVDSTGEIKEVWVGKLRHDKESEVLSKIFA